MIVWFNCKITDERFNPVESRGNIRTDRRYDVAKYTFASLAPLNHIISKIIFTLELVEDKGREQEMEEWIYSLFPQEKVHLEWRRCNTLADWKELRPVIASVDDDLLYLAGNDDHVFFDSNTLLYEKGLSLLSADENIRTALVNCHYPESMVEAFGRSGQLTPCGNFVVSYNKSTIGVVVIKRDLYYRWLEQKIDPTRTIFRLDGWYEDWYEKIIAPTKEIGRHYDGYNRTMISPNLCPPIDIPIGFFEKEIVIRYGFADRDPHCVNINPLSENLFVTDKNGADYKFTLDDIPAFWKPFIKHIEISTDVNHTIMANARDRHYIKMGFSHPTLEIPSAWVRNHLIANNTNAQS